MVEAFYWNFLIYDLTGLMRLILIWAIHKSLKCRNLSTFAIIVS